MINHAKLRRGRPPGFPPLITRAMSGAYIKKTTPAELLNYWREHMPGNAMRVDKITAQFIQTLECSDDSERVDEVQDLAVRIVSRDALFMKLLELDFRRATKDPDSGGFVAWRAADQFGQLKKLDNEIDRRLENLGLMPAYKSRKSKKTKEGDIRNDRKP